MSFVKLDTGILLSSIWSESPEVRVVWITLLAMADQNGLVAASATGVAKMAGLPLETVCAALDLFQAPDPHSRTPDDEGRRLARVDGGYVLLNHEKYRESKDIEARREQVREAVAKHRERKRAGCNHGVITGNQGKPLRSRSEADAETEAEQRTDTPPAPKGGACLAEFTAAFNAAYERDCKPPTLNRSQEQQLKRLVANHGPKGACCLPLLAWAYDQAKGGGERVRTRAVSHLLRDGERGTFVWATLLETAPTVARCGGNRTHERRLWRVAEQLGLADALEGFGCERPPEAAPATQPAPVSLEQAKAEGLRLFMERSLAKLEPGA